MELYEALEEHAVDSDSTPLHQFVDPGPLERAVNPLDDDFEVAFAADTISITVTPDGVRTYRRE